MSDWIPKEEMMRRLKRSERTLQQYVKDGKLERRTGEDKRAWYRETQRDATERGVAQRDAAEPPPWAVELAETLRRVEAKIDAQRALQAGVETFGPPPPEPPPRNESQRRSDPQRPLWKRLLGIA